MNYSTKQGHNPEITHKPSMHSIKLVLIGLLLIAAVWILVF
ncbi:MAG: hypothetical protein ACI936_002852, partial [Paraglaciecola sp.]